MPKLILISLIIFSFLQAKTLEEKFSKRLPAKDIEKVIISNKNGGIEVESWGNDEIEIVAYKKVRASGADDAQKLLDALKIEIEQYNSELEIKTVYPDRKDGGGLFSWLLGMGGGNYSVHYEIKVPEKMDLDLHSTNGNIEVNGCGGIIALRTTNGKISADDVAGALSCKSTNGSIKAYIKSVSDNEDMTFKTTNGSIKVYMPQDVNADLKAHTTNGSINCDLPIKTRYSSSRRSLEAQINDGGPQLYFKTTNGSIHIREI